MIAAIAATLALAAPSREALVERWITANHAHAKAELSSGPPRQSGAPLDLRALARRELAVPGRYHVAAPAFAPPGEPWWLRAVRWVADRWNDFWSKLFGHARLGRQQAIGIGDVLLVIVGLLLLYAVIRLLRELQFVRSASNLRAEPLEESPPPRGLYRQACDAAATGAYGVAVLLLFAAMLALLDRRGTVDLSSSTTVGDVRRALRARHAELVGPFDAVAGPFVQRAYAERQIGEPQWEHARSAFEGMLQ